MALEIWLQTAASIPVQRAAALAAMPKFTSQPPKMNLVGSLAELTPAPQRQAALDALQRPYGDDDNGPKAA